VTEALLVGRTPGKLISQKSPVVSEALFQAERVDQQTFEGVRFEHCTFANVSFKEARLISCTFENCAFIDCYFRMTVLESSRLLGCKFISCDFPKAAFRHCSFVYSQFRSCFVPYAVFEPSLPTEANLRRLLADNLAREAEAAGATNDARRYRLRASEALEHYLWGGLVGADQGLESTSPACPTVESPVSASSDGG
jgi:uncharacterized protein YjbI with pentapeptide repeats